MADADVSITAGSGTKIDTRTVGAGTDEHRQVVVIGDPVTAANVATVDANGCQNVLIRQPQFWSNAGAAANVPGVAAAAYAAGDQFGTLITIANAARFTGLGGHITGVTLFDDDDLQVGADVYFYDASVSLAADNAVYAVSDADGRKELYCCQIPYFRDNGANRVGAVTGISVPYVCTGTSLFVAIRTQSAVTPTATGVAYRISMIRD